MNNELVKEIYGKEYHFKLKSKKVVDLEKMTGKNIMELLQDASMSNAARLLKASCLETADEYELLDGLLDIMPYEKVITDVILEIAMISGIISKSDLDRVNSKIDEEKNQ